MESIKYIAQNQRDREWGLAVCSVGHQKIAPGEEYPPQKHNPEYMFDPSHGRVLPEYQMIYIADGKGALVTKSAGRINVCSGDMFILFPGEWHSYKPDESTGWNEYWIGFQGINIDNRVHAGFFSPEAPLFHNSEPSARHHIHDRKPECTEKGRGISQHREYGQKPYE